MSLFKKTFFFVIISICAIFCLLFSGCTTDSETDSTGRLSNFEIKGKVIASNEIPLDNYVILIDAIKQDTATVSRYQTPLDTWGNFQLKAHISETDVYILTMVRKKDSTHLPNHSFLLFIEPNSQITLTLPYKGFENAIVEGSASHDLFEAMKKAIDKNKEITDIYEAQEAILISNNRQREVFDKLAQQLDSLHRLQENILKGFIREHIQ
ncbi:MAG: DUF4369 domain-containing protein [Bernardetiaceae bacterium]|nr:DUF4369 domain-containing protein [Bernardetiaceae bacterium]